MTCNPRHRAVAAPVNEVDRADALRVARAFFERMATRRSIRDYTTRPVDPELIRLAIATANTAPSGANRQPWHFVVVSDPDRKQHIRDGAEQEERAFYSSASAGEWLAALEPLGTDWRKPHLTDAPFLIVVFEVHRGPSGEKAYYLKESVGIAVGLLLASLHHAGLATLTHTPSPMRFLNAILDRPSSEKPFLVIPVGYAAGDASVPDIAKKSPEDVTDWR